MSSGTSVTRSVKVWAALTAAALAEVLVVEPAPTPPQAATQAAASTDIAAARAAR
jgi:hypothetical protein